MHNSQREEVTVDEAFQKSIGEFGAGQRFISFLVSEYTLELLLSLFLFLVPSPGYRSVFTFTRDPHSRDDACAGIPGYHSSGYAELLNGIHWN